MPQRAKELMEKVIKLSQDAVFKLESEPAATIDYVNLLTFLSEIQLRQLKVRITHSLTHSIFSFLHHSLALSPTLSQVDGIEQDAEIVKELYELVEMYQVPIPPEHLAIYQTLKPAVTNLRTSIDEAESSTWTSSAAILTRTSLN